jgi:hypothetical protein
MKRDSEIWLALGGMAVFVIMFGVCALLLILFT